MKRARIPGARYFGRMLKRIDHIGIVVDDLDSGRRFLEGLGFQLAQDVAVPERGIHVSFWRCGEVAIELIQMDEPEANRERLRGETQARIEHIAFEVDDLDATIEDVKARGLELTGPPSHLAALGTTSVWTKPETSDGYQLQLFSRQRA